ncbi:hypothetical protein [Parvularcula oceani]|uniref:hypothetical protein n=1 Tax=Parvularcula oceani TaxID=1247963 RepID=UPI0004E198E7|nr:hypothetical protein [Parvularcula oceani]
MRDVDRAIADIATIRGQIAAGTLFRGFGPLVTAATGGLALLLAAAQSVWPGTLAAGPGAYFTAWIALAVICAALVGVEMWFLSRRHHRGLALAMMGNAVEHFLPAGAAGAAVMFVLHRFAPDTLWMLPGIWQVLLALALCSAARMLPPPALLVGAWYLAAGLIVLALAGTERSLDPWMMGLPFAVGQGLMALILKRAGGGDHAAR